MLDEQEAFHADITVAAKLDLTRAGLSATGFAFNDTATDPSALASIPFELASRKTN